MCVRRAYKRNSSKWNTKLQPPVWTHWERWEYKIPFTWNEAHIVLYTATSFATPAKCLYVFCKSSDNKIRKKLQREKQRRRRRIKQSDNVVDKTRDLRESERQKNRGDVMRFNFQEFHIKNCKKVTIHTNRIEFKSCAHARTHGFSVNCFSESNKIAN